MRYDVFISYSNNDALYANTVCTHLERSGINCWIAPRNISAGSDWAAEIIDAMNAVPLMLFVFSSSSNASPQVKREIERAIHKNVKIIPLRIENILPSKSMEYFLSSQHWFDAFVHPLEHYLVPLTNHIRSLLGHGSEQQTTFTAPQPLPIAEPLETAAPPLSRETLQFVETALADFIGPVAGILVKRTAAKTSNYKTLTDLLAVELEKEDERKRFVANCERYRL